MHVARGVVREREAGGHLRDAPEEHERGGELGPHLRPEEEERPRRVVERVDHAEGDERARLLLRVHRAEDGVHEREGVDGVPGERGHPPADPVPGAREAVAAQEERDAAAPLRRGQAHHVGGHAERRQAGRDVADEHGKHVVRAALAARRRQRQHRHVRAATRQRLVCGGTSGGGGGLRPLCGAPRAGGDGLREAPLQREEARVDVQRVVPVGGQRLVAPERARRQDAGGHIDFKVVRQVGGRGVRVARDVDGGPHVVRAGHLPQRVLAAVLHLDPRQGRRHRGLVQLLGELRRHVAAVGGVRRHENAAQQENGTPRDAQVLRGRVQRPDGVVAHLLPERHAQQRQLPHGEQRHGVLEHVHRRLGEALQRGGARRRLRRAPLALQAHVHVEPRVVGEARAAAVGGRCRRRRAEEIVQQLPRQAHGEVRVERVDGEGRPVHLHRREVRRRRVSRGREERVEEGRHDRDGQQDLPPAVQHLRAPQLEQAAQLRAVPPQRLREAAPPRRAVRGLGAGEVHERDQRRVQPLLVLIRPRPRLHALRPGAPRRRSSAPGRPEFDGSPRLSTPPKEDFRRLRRVLSTF